MTKDNSSDSGSEEKFSSEEAKTEEGNPRVDEKVSPYEKQRLKRIEENKKRMEALGLRKMASSFKSSVEKTQKKKNEKRGKKIAVDEDEEYNPAEDSEEGSSSGEDAETDEEFSMSKQKKVKKNSSTTKNGGATQKLIFDSDFVEDDDALMQAIALSLQDSAGFLDVTNSASGLQHKKTAPSKTPVTSPVNTSIDKRKENLNIQEESKRKRKNPNTSRVQMSEDEMLIHFFQFDETGRGGITLSDIRRLATAHDFTWSEKEIADMIHCFDSDGDGKISFDDFRKIVDRCHMLKGSDNDRTA